MCSDARSLAHDAKELAKETRRIQNTDKRVVGVALADDPPELAPVDLVPIPMPPISDDVFYFGAPPADDEENVDAARHEEDEEEAYDEEAELSLGPLVRLFSPFWHLDAKGGEEFAIRISHDLHGLWGTNFPPFELIF